MKIIKKVSLWKSLVFYTSLNQLELSEFVVIQIKVKTSSIWLKIHLYYA